MEEKTMIQILPTQQDKLDFQNYLLSELPNLSHHEYHLDVDLLAGVISWEKEKGSSGMIVYSMAFWELKNSIQLSIEIEIGEVEDFAVIPFTLSATFEQSLCNYLSVMLSVCNKLKL